MVNRKAPASDGVEGENTALPLRDFLDLRRSILVINHDFGVPESLYLRALGFIPDQTDQVDAHSLGKLGHGQADGRVAGILNHIVSRLKILKVIEEATKPSMDSEWKPQAAPWNQRGQEDQVVRFCRKIILPGTPVIRERHGLAHDLLIDACSGSDDFACTLPARNGRQLSQPSVGSVDEPDVRRMDGRSLHLDEDFSGHRFRNWDFLQKQHR